MSTHTRIFASVTGARLMLLVLGLLFALPGYGELRIELYGTRAGYDSQGTEENLVFDNYLNSSMPGLENLPTITDSFETSGAVFSAGGPLGAMALASYGYLQVNSTAGGVASTGFAGVTTHAYSGALDVHSHARFEDDVTIHAPGMTGQTGVFTARFRFDPYIVVEGFVVPEHQPPGSQVSAMIFADVSANWRINDERGSYGSWQHIDSIGTEEADDFPEGDIQVQVPFVYGDAFRLRVRVSATALIDAHPNGFARGRATAGFPASFRWLGMTNLPEGAMVEGAIDWSLPALEEDQHQEPDDPPPSNPPVGGEPQTPGTGGTSGGGKSGGAFGFFLLWWMLALVGIQRRRWPCSLVRGGRND